MKKRLIEMTWKELPVWASVMNGLLVILFLLIFLFKSKIMVVLWAIGVFAWVGVIMFVDEAEVRK